MNYDARNHELKMQYKTMQQILEVKCRYRNMLRVPKSYGSTYTSNISITRQPHVSEHPHIKWVRQKEENR